MPSQGSPHKPYFVCVEFTTDEDNRPVPEDMAAEDLPRCFYGPFATLKDAVSWMCNDYPDGDTDVHDMYEFQPDDPEALGFVNSPDAVHGDPTPCCPDPDCPGRGSGACTFPGYAANH